MDQPDHVMSVNIITVCKIIRKVITKMNFRYQIDVTKRAKKICLVPKIYFSYYFRITLHTAMAITNVTWSGWSMALTIVLCYLKSIVLSLNDVLWSSKTYFFVILKLNIKGIISQVITPQKTWSKILLHMFTSVFFVIFQLVETIFENNQNLTSIFENQK